jgi:hypothetical protein
MMPRRHSTSNVAALFAKRISTRLARGIAMRRCLEGVAPESRPQRIVEIDPILVLVEKLRQPACEIAHPLGQMARP